MPVVLGYLPVGFAFAVTAVAGGLPPWAAVLISLTNFTSAGQLAGATLILAGAPVLEIGLTVFIINIRYVIMGMSLSQRLTPGMGTGQRLVGSMAITDELFTIASLRKGEITFPYLGGLFLLPYVGWGGGTLIGAYAAEWMPAQLQASMGIALYAMFVALLLPEAKRSKAVTVVALVAMTSSVLFEYVPLLSGVSAGYVIIIGTVLGAAVGAALFPMDEEESGEGGEVG